FDGSTYTKLLGPIFSLIDPLFASVGARLYFALGGGGALAPEVWASDGTTAGTYRVQDLTSAGVRELVSITPVGTQAFVFVLANDGTSQLWRSDGTPNAMQLVKAQLASPYGYGARPAAVGDRLLFAHGDLV